MPGRRRIVSRGCDPLIVSVGPVCENVLCQYLAMMYTGPGCQKPLEEANGFIKAHLMRSSASTVARFVVLWCLARLKGLAPQWGRADTQIQSTRVAPANPDEKLFEFAALSLREDRAPVSRHRALSTLPNTETTLISLAL